MFRRFPLLLVALALFTAACTSAGVPSSYADQDGRVEKQFVAACEGALEGEQEEGFCQCAFYTFASVKTFEDFLILDEKLKDDPGSLINEDRRLIENITLPCAKGPEDINNG